jgi:hypothetical protein
MNGEPNEPMNRKSQCELKEQSHLWNIAENYEIKTQEIYVLEFTH